MKDNKMDRLLSDEREVQHFGFSSTFLISELRSSIIYNITETHKEMGNCIIRKLSLSDEAGGIIHSEMKNLSDLYKTKLDEFIKKHEEGIREFFKIPENINFTSCKTSDELKNINSDTLREEVNQLEEQYQKNKQLLVLYKDESTNFDCTAALQEQVAQYLEELKIIHLKANQDLSVDDLWGDYEELLKSHCNNYKTKSDVYLSKFKTQEERILLPE